MTWLTYFNKLEWSLWGGSVGAILLFYAIQGGDPLTLVASLVGVTSLMFNAKGHPIGQVLMLVFSLLYGLISWQFAYYGEMITYLGMTAPMAAVALVAWLRHPFEGSRSQVAVGRIGRREVLLLVALTAAVTVAFYFILAAFRTANLLPSTVSVATSFVAAYLTFRRSPYFALAYAANDVVLIVLWVMATLADPGYGAVTVCFVAFLVNDLYGFVSWKHMEREQGKKRRI